MTVRSGVSPPVATLVGRPQPLEIKAARESLIGERGIGKPVAEHHGALPQCRSDEMCDVLTSRSEDQHGFGLRRDWFVRRRREENMADRFSGCSATWFSGLEYAVSCLSQRLREVANLGAFPTTFDSLQGNKQAASLLLLCSHCLGAPSSVKKTGGMVFQVVENSKKRLARPSEFSV